MKYQQLGNTDMIVSEISFGYYDFYLTFYHNFFEIALYTIGAGPLGNLYRKTDFEESYKVVHSALKQGINMIDSAPWYGNGKSETTLGKVS